MALATDSPLIPEEFFHALSMMVARMMFICEKECRLKPIELLILWHIKHVGATKEDRPVLVRREEMTRVLKEKFDYESDDVAKLLSRLFNEGLIDRKHLTRKELVKYFGSADGQTLVVILTDKGVQKIEKFKATVRSRADQWVSERGKPTRAAIFHSRALVARLSNWIIKRYEPQDAKT